MPWTNPPRTKRRFNPKAAVIITLGLALSATLAVVAISIEKGRSDPAAGQTVIRAYERAARDDGADAEDQNLADDEAAAGVMWARTHLSSGPTACPSSPEAFARGCVDQATKVMARP